ncbi:MAG: ABC-F family ATP-binding cassette domain-containing protein [Actinomycetota bacterium]
MSSLEISGLAVEVAGLPILEDLDLVLGPGDKAGIVGRNGAGKTSLLTVLAGERAPLRGTVTVRGSLGYLRQDPRQHAGADAQDALAHLLDARDVHATLVRLEKYRLAVEEDPSDANVRRYSRLEERFRESGGYAAEAEARRIAAGLGLPQDRLDLSVTALSGGERRRLELARILFAGADVLFLDEPTNHLDVDAKTWLMKFLAGYRGALVVVSHDLALLDAAITRVVHLDRDGVVQYRGTYSQYREARRRDEERLRALATRQAAEIDRLKRLADSMRGQTEKRARKAKTLDTRVARLRRSQVQGPRRERRIAYRFPDPPHAGKLVIETAGLTKGYGAEPVFQDVTFDLARGERLLVLGLNGAGKTSLLRILAGVTEADAGTMRFGSGVSMGYYAQEHEGIREGVAVIDHVREAASEADDQTLRSLLGMFGLSGDIAHQDAGTLSGGEKTKLALAQLVAGRRNLVLLDEPTNNLDPPSRTAIAEALAAWPGSMVIVSHDVEFVAALAPDRVLAMPEGDLLYWEDGFLDLVALA